MRQEQRIGRPGPLGRTRSRLTTMTEWRDWALPVKLGAVMLVPTLLALVLGIVLIKGQVSSAATYTGAEQRTSLATKVRAVAEALQNERAAQAGKRVPGNKVGKARLRALRSKVDTAFGGLRAGFDTTPPLDYAAESGWTETARQIGRLSNVRETADSPLGVPSAIASYYTDILDSVLGLERSLLSKVADPQLAGQAASLYDIDAAKEEVSFQESTVLVGLTRERLLRDELQALRGSKTRFDQLIDDLRSVGGEQLASEYDQTVSGDDVSERADAFRRILDGADGGIDRSPAEMTDSSIDGSLGDLDAAAWVTNSARTTDGLNTFGTRVSDRLGEQSAELQSGSSDRAGLTAVLLFVALLVAAAIVTVIARQLLRSMRILRRRARTIAERELPEAVSQIQAGNRVSTEVTPVQVDTKEELGQLARAFDDLHSQARKLATEQAALRASYGNVFVNLSRRSQSLVQRQLRLIERLERDEEDPDQLATLFQLDHLATRMRRNNENLMVLSGGEQARSVGNQPTGIADLLRAAVSEIEQYQRVEVQPPPGVLVVGYVAGDLVRLVAELLDNATAFSAPETQVTVSTRIGSDGAVSIDVIDQGVGMRTEDMVAANDRLGTPNAAAVPEARRMGLFVVSKLAGRHGIAVSLHGAEDIDGIRACVVVPANLVAATEKPPAPLTLAESTDGRDLRAAGGPPVGPTMPAPAAPFGYELDELDTGNGHRPVREPSVDDRPTEQYPLVPAQERAAASDWAAGVPGGSTGSGSDIPSSEELFTPVRPAKPRPDPEQTPIFDEMISAWFVAADTAQPAEPAEPEQVEEFDIFSVAPAQQEDRNSPQWNFEADRGWEAVEAVSRKTPESFTSVGLPRRTPRARLVPGSVGAQPRPDEQAATRDPENVRHRLSSFQRGVSEGRASGEAGQRAVEADQRAAEAAPEKPALPSRRSGGSTGNRNGHDDNGRSTDVFPATGNGAGGTNGHAATNGNTRNGAANGTGAAGSRGTGGQTKGDKSDKPKATQANGKTANGRSDAAASNGSTSNGAASKGSASNGSATNGSTANGGTANGGAIDGGATKPGGGTRNGGTANGDHRYPSPRRQPDIERTAREPAGPQRSGSHRDIEDTQAWSFAADEGWRAAAERTAEPSSEELTSAGLPRRTPRARLVPGSAAEQGTAVEQGGAADAPRDAANIRDRLTSFQRGISDGRHSLAGTAQDTHAQQQEKE